MMTVAELIEILSKMPQAATAGVDVHPLYDLAVSTVDYDEKSDFVVIRPIKREDL